MHTIRSSGGPWSVVAVIAAVAATGPAGAVEVNGMKDFAALHGRYAPGGQCEKQPRFTVDASGIAFEVTGATDKVERLEFAASYGGMQYEGISLWFFPFRNANGWPVLITFNADETAGRVTITPHDEGWPDGPKLAARHHALVIGSPYQRCQ
jgi:hypothetical protein